MACGVEGKISAPRSLLGTFFYISRSSSSSWYFPDTHEHLNLCCVAGLGAGMTEAVLAVTPSETIKYVSSLYLPLPFPFPSHVRLILPLMLSAELNSSTTLNVHNHNTAVSCTGRCPSSDKKVSVVSIVVFSPSYVHFSIPLSSHFSSSNILTF